MVAVGILAGAIGAIFLLLGLVLACPLRLEVMLQKDEVWNLAAALRPFGRYGPQIPLRRSQKKLKEPEVKVKKPSAMTRAARREPTRVASAALQFLRDVVRCVRIEEVRCHARFGCEDPADTGQVFGLLAPVLYGTAHARRLDLRIEPAFSGAVLSGRAEVALSLIPARLLPPVIRFGWIAFGPVR